MPFCDSASTQISARTRARSVARAVDLVDDHLDAVRHLLEGPPEHLLADELGEHQLLGLVGAVGGVEQERALRHERREVLEQRLDPRALPRRDREDVVGDVQLGGRGERLDGPRPVQAIQLVDGQDHREPRRLQHLGDQRSPGPMPS